MRLSVLATWVIRLENRSFENNYPSRLIRSKSPVLATYDICSEMDENNYPNRLEQILVNNSKYIYGSGNNFILPVIPVQGSQEPFWERLKFTLISCIGA